MQRKSVSFDTLHKPSEVRQTNSTDIFQIIKDTPLFKKAQPTTTEYASKNCRVEERKKGEEFSLEEKGLFVILDGTAVVYGKSKNHPVILNTLKKHRVFGMASLFGEECRTTFIKAKENCLYAFISQDTVEKMLKNDIEFTKSYISFLSDKIRFLNKKISFFTSGSAEKKLAGYLLSLPCENGEITLDMTMSKVASSLDMGRASLYRAFDSLEESCFIERNNNVIKVNSIDEFKKIYGESL